jgi:hypothetical protein
MKTRARKVSMAIGCETGNGGTSFESEARLLIHLGSKLRTVATIGTTGYARASGRVFDSQPRCQLR